MTLSTIREYDAWTVLEIINKESSFLDAGSGTVRSSRWSLNSSFFVDFFQWRNKAPWPERNIDRNGEEEWEGVEAVKESFDSGEVTAKAFRKLDRAVNRTDLLAAC